MSDDQSSDLKATQNEKHEHVESPVAQHDDAYQKKVMYVLFGKFAL